MLFVAIVKGVDSLISSPQKDGKYTESLEYVYYYVLFEFFDCREIFDSGAAKLNQHKCIFKI